MKQIKKVHLFLVAAFAVCISAHALHAETITFTSSDGVDVTADFEKGTNAVAIVLFHQAGSSRGEYKTIAPRLNALGYTTLAVDQRSGGSHSGVRNETVRAARSAGKSREFTDAIPDLKAAITHARGLDGINRVIMWGSSYSASLSLILAGDEPELADGVLAFSPGEYFGGRPSVEKAARGIQIPAFISSAKNEVRGWRSIHKAIPASAKAVAFIPKGAGQHGSSTLIKRRSRNAEEYWTAVESFLKANFAG